MAYTQLLLGNKIRSLLVAKFPNQAARQRLHLQERQKACDLPSEKFQMTMLTYADSALEMRRNTRQCHQIFKSMQLCSSAAQILRSFHAASANHDGRHSSARDVKLIRPEAHNSEAMKTRGR